MKTCRDCRNTFPAETFPQYSNNRGPRPICRTCFNLSENVKRKARRDADPAVNQRQLDVNKSYRARNGTGYIEHQVRKRASEKGLYFSDVVYRCKQLCRSSHSRALSKGLPFSISAQDITALIEKQDGKCAQTGIVLDFSAHPTYFRNPCAPSIDRIENDKGYVLDNVQIVAAWYNLLKNEWSDADVRLFVQTAYLKMFGE